MQVTSNYSPVSTDNFNQPTNSSDSVKNRDNLDSSITSDPYSTSSTSNTSTASKTSSTNTNNNTVIKESPKQPDQSSDKYKQQNLFFSEYQKFSINSLLNNKTQAANIKPGTDSSIQQPNALSQPTSSTVANAKSETTKATNDPSKGTIKENLYTEWGDEKGNPLKHPQNVHNDIIRKAVESPDNPFPEISPIQLKALIWTESKFDPKAGSSKGALGLAQITQITAKDVGLDANARTNPDQAIPAALKVLNNNLKYVSTTNRSGYGLDYYSNGKPLPKEEKLKLGLAVYNAGTKEFRRALNEAYKGKVPPDGPKFDDIKRFLPEETRNYVPKVLERANK